MARFSALPAPVARYLECALQDRSEDVTRARFDQAGEFLLRPGARHGFARFEAVEDFVVDPPGFAWEARIRIGPGLSVRVHDALRAGRGSMRAELLGIVRLAAPPPSHELTAGALHRYLAEAVLLPSALAPGHGVTWTPLDENRARATLTEGGVMVALDFTFRSADGLVDSVYAADRMRASHGRFLPTPWRGLWRDYEIHGGMRVPTRGEVAWLLPDGPLTYWRGRIRSYLYDFADARSA